MKIGVLTGGGDCPGLNAAIRAIVHRGGQLGYKVTGIREGWEGLLEGKTEPLDSDSTSEILSRGGTILGTSRTNPFKREGGPTQALESAKKLGLSALIAIGGEDTLGVAQKLSEMGLPCVGVPKTIDNDLSCTDYTIGFDSAVSIVAENLDRIHTTAESHRRVIVVEVMGRHAGWIAAESGIAGGADLILIPEKPFDLDEVCELLRRQRARGKKYNVVVVAEGAKPASGEMIAEKTEVDEFGHVKLGGIGAFLAGEIQKRTGYETRTIQLGHVQRGGSPTAFDRILATRFGIKAVELVKEGEFGKMVALQGNNIVSVDLKEAVGKPKNLDLELYNVGKVFFGD